MYSTIQRVSAAATTLIAGKQNAQRYETLPQDSREEVRDEENPRVSIWQRRQSQVIRWTVVGIIILLGVALFTHGLMSARKTSGGRQYTCDSVQDGYECELDISRFWGQYSPYFTAPSEISADVPKTCQITFAQILSRHGARDPTLSSTVKYNETIGHIHRHAQSYKGKTAFIKDYQYHFGADQLTPFGEQQMVNSGLKFYSRYPNLSRQSIPFVRTSGQERVVKSAEKWTQGFHAARLADKSVNHDETYPYGMVIIPEGSQWNNSLDHSLCTQFEEGFASHVGGSAQHIWADIFTPPITRRLNKKLRGVELSKKQTIHLMDMCPFDTVAHVNGSVSPFCDIFTEKEWQQYDYYQSLGKYYGFGSGNPLGSTQGVGFANELIARLIASPAHDHTSTNTTLDDSLATFPIGGETKLYADFSHDNDLTGMFAALGFYNATSPLSNTTLHNTKQTNGYSASWTVPFAARLYVEKMQCEGEKEEYVRALVNDRVIPLQNCDADRLGRCTLSNFVESLSFVRAGGLWNQCFI